MKVGYFYELFYVIYRKVLKSKMNKKKVVFRIAFQIITKEEYKKMQTKNMYITSIKSCVLRADNSTVSNLM